jgi:hypothetical protein
MSYGGRGREKNSPAVVVPEKTTLDKTRKLEQAKSYDDQENSM